MAAFKSTGGINGGTGFTLEGDFIGSFNRLINDMPDICNKALNTGAYIIKENIKSVFKQKMPAAGRPFKVPATSKGGYKITKPDTLIDAIRQSKSHVTHATISVQGNESGSPLFIARMYNTKTKSRYAKTWRGQKLRKPRYVGEVGGLNYFETGISGAENQAYDAMQRILENYITKELS